MPDFLSIMPVKSKGASLYAGGTPEFNGQAPAVAPPGPTLQDVLKRLNEAKGAGDETFQKGVGTIRGQVTAPGVLDPGYQKTLDQIRANAAYYGKQGASAAQALAVRRGLPGSSIEQFGVQTAYDNTNRTAADQEATLYQQNMARQQALQDQLAKLYGTRAGEETTLGGNLATTGAQLTSDEIASLRNIDLYQQQLALQRQLGEQGIDVAKQNIDQARKIAQQNGWMNFGSAVAGGAVPWVLNSLWPAQAAASGVAATGAGAAGAGAGAAGAGAAGAGAAGLSPVVGGAAIVGAGYASAKIAEKTQGVLDKNLGDNAVSKTAGFLLHPMGTQINAVKDAAKKLFGGGKSSPQMQYSGRDYSKHTIEEVATGLGKEGWGVDYDSNKSGSFENNFNGMLDALGPEGALLRYKTVPDDQLETGVDRARRQFYKDAVTLYGPNVTADQYLDVVSKRDPRSAAALIGGAVRNA